MILAGGQLVVPSVATTVLRHRLAKDGSVISVKLSALPWFQLLWGDADSVTVRMGEYSPAPHKLRTLINETDGIGTLDVSVAVVRTGLLRLHDVSFSKRGDQLVAAAQLDLRDLQQALPIIQSVVPVRDGDGRLLLRGTAGVLGVNATIDLVVAARDGKLVVAPAGLFGAFATITLFDDPQIHVESVSASEVPGGLRFQARGRVV